MRFEDSIVERTVDKLIAGQDYREEIVNAINAEFFDFTMDFFRKIVDAKLSGNPLNMEWYKQNFINIDKFDTNDVVVFAGINKKTIMNIYGTASKEIVLEVSNKNFDYLMTLLKELEEDENQDLLLTMKICYNEINVNLNLTESLLVINALATKKIQIRGGAWSSIGKRVEKPLLNKLCEMAGVPEEYIDNGTFKKDKTKKVSREIDYKLKSKDGKTYLIEVKLMGKGNPESADATIARKSDIFVADTLSEQDKEQLKEENTEYLELKNNKNTLDDFKKILTKLDIPFTNK